MATYAEKERGFQNAIISYQSGDANILTMYYKFAYAQTVLESTFKTGVILMIAEPYTLGAVLWLVIAGFVIFISRLFYEVFLTKPIMKVFRFFKRKLSFKKNIPENHYERRGEKNLNQRNPRANKNANH